MPEHGGQGKCDAAGDGKDDGVLKRVGNSEVSGDTGNAVSCRAEAEDSSHQGTCSAADHTSDEGLEEAHVHTEDSGLGDTKSCGQGGRDSHGLGLLVLDFQTDSKAGAELCEVRCGRDGHPGVEAALSQHTSLDDVVHVVQTHDDGRRVNSAHDTSADGVPDQDLCSCKDVGLQGGEDRSDDPQGQECGDKNGGQRGNEEVDHLRDVLMQPLLDLAHDEHGDNDRDDVSLIA